MGRDMKHTVFYQIYVKMIKNVDYFPLKFVIGKFILIFSLQLYFNQYQLMPNLLLLLNNLKCFL